MELGTERIAVLKFSRLELAQALAAGELSDEAKQKMRAWLTGENQEIVDGIISIPALTAGDGNGHGEHEDLPATRRAMRKFRQATKRGKKKMRRAYKLARTAESCKYCGKGFRAHGWLVSHEARCAQNPERVTLES